MNSRKSFITGINTTYLKKSEIKFLKKNKPWGVILFSRNIKSLSQTKKLVDQIKNCFNDNNYPILIDEEGGRVSRIKNIIDTKIFSSKYFASLYLKNKKKFFYHYKIYINTVSQILNDLGININTVPVLDVLRNKTSKLIGDRSFSKDPEIVSKLGDYCINLYSKNKIGTVIKHIPGHGLATSDSHYVTPVINANKKILNSVDFKVFKNKNTLFAMTAHIIYSQYDLINTATHSSTIIRNVVRGKIKFMNLIISDDISMKALKYDLKSNIVRALKAGCNLILHCNGNIKEMNIVANNAPLLDRFIIKKTSQFYRFLM